MAADQMLAVEVVFARAEEQVVVALSVPAGTTVAQALERSALVVRFPEIGREPTLGVFGRVVAADTPLNAGDRVEIYRPLVADPKQARRRRAATTVRTRA